MRRRQVLTAAAGAVAVAGLGSQGRARADPAPAWLPLKDMELTVAGRGNALDFSALVPPGPAGGTGWAQPMDEAIVFERARTPQRFFCASMVFSPPNGGAPDKAEAKRLVAELRAVGYNAVRFQFIDAYLMQGRTRDFDFDPQALDRVHLLLAELKASGIAWIVDGLSSDNGAYGDVGPNRYARRHDARLEALISDAGFAHWAGVVDGIWGARNPYTGTSTLRDPALLGIMLINEGGITFLAYISGGRYPPALAAPFTAWLRTHYADDERLRMAWGGELGAEESLRSAVHVPERIRGRSPRDRDFARFVVDTESAGMRRMEAHVRAQGFGGLSTAFNSGPTFASDISRRAADWVDMHSYNNLPSKYATPGSVVKQSSLFDSLAAPVRVFACVRQWGKPFSASEYGQQFWNGFRYEMGPLVAAMGRHQGWSLVSQFAETPIQMDYALAGAPRRRAIYPNGIGADPIDHCVERLVALLYARGDVAASPHRIRLHLDAETVLARGIGGDVVPEALSRLSLVAPLGLDFGPMPAYEAAGELSFDLGAAPADWLARLRGSPTRGGIDQSDDLLVLLRGAAIIGTSNASRPAALHYQSDTGQIGVDGAQRLLRITTPRCCVLSFRGGDAAAGPLSVTGANGPALFAAAALDEQPLVRSRHLLVWVLTDAVNSGMRFADEARTTLAELGTFPPVVRTISVKISLGLTAPTGLRVWPLALNGERRELLPVQISNDSLALALNTAALPGGPALLFEVAAP